MTDGPSSPTPPVPPGWSAEQPPPYPTQPVAAGWGPPPVAQQPEAPRPGVVPLRPLSVLEILDGAITTMRRYPKPMLGLSFAVTLATALVGFAVSVLGLSGLAALEDVDARTAGVGDFASAVGPLLAGTALAALVQALALVVLSGMLTIVVGEAVLGREVSIGQAWRLVRPRLLRLIALSVLFAVAVLVGLSLCLVPGIALGVFWALAAPALVLEKSTIAQAFARSWALVSGRWWRTFGIVVLVILTYYIINTAVSVPFAIGSFLFPLTDPSGQLNTGWFVVSQGLSTVGSVVGGTIAFPFVCAALALTYIDRRMDREGLDIELARRAVPPTQ